jgi:hypothetical protein
MWKRMQRNSTNNKARETQIGNPVLVESSLDDEVLQRLPDVQEAQAAKYESNTRATQPSSLPL